MEDLCGRDAVRQALGELDAQEGTDLDEGEEAQGGRPLPRNAEELARDLRFIQMELMMSSDATDEDEDT